LTDKSRHRRVGRKTKRVAVECFGAVGPGALQAKEIINNNTGKIKERKKKGSSPGGQRDYKQYCTPGGGGES